MANKNNKSLFWRIYGISLAVASVIVAIGIIVMSVWLKDYEASQPKYLAESVFKEYFESFNADKYVRKCNMDKNGVDYENDIKYLTDITNGQKIEYHRVSTGVDSGFKYIVKAGDSKFASFKLEEDSKSNSNFKQYKATDFEYYVVYDDDIEILVPTGYIVFVDGNEVSEEYITKTKVETESCNHMPKGVTGIYNNKYTIPTLSEKPVIKVTAKNGQEANVIKNSNGEYVAQPISDNSLKEEFNDWILKGMKRYSEYMQHSSNNPVSFREISVYFDPDSNLYKDIETSENMFVWDYDSYNYENEETSNYVSYDKNTFSCTCKFVQVLHKSGQEDYEDNIDVTLYLRNVNGEFLIYDMNQN